MEGINVIEGGVATDERGCLTHFNALDMSEVQRCFFLNHPDVDVVRAWSAHRCEKKWFTVVKGAFTLALVKIDNWEAPSPDLVPEIFHLSAEEPKVICVPEGYANGMKAEEPGSTMMVLSNKSMKEAVDADDDWRYDKELWMKW